MKWLVCLVLGHRWHQCVSHDMPQYLAECFRCGALRWFCRCGNCRK
jgi:hypothetical protein